MMRLIGGLVGWEPGSSITEPVLRTMARSVPDVGAIAVRAGGAAGLFSSIADAPTTVNQIDVVADLDLTNAEELCKATGATGPAELLAALYALEGPTFIGRLRGAFAVALWDRRRCTLVLAVDHFGVKRLHYTENSRQIAFASRLEPLRCAPNAASSIDPAGVYAYLNFGYVPAGVPIVAGIHRLPPGHRLIARSGRTVLERYWDLSYHEIQISKRDAAAGLYDFTEQAVARALHGLAPKEHGAFLSGGTDSSTIVGLASRLTGERVNAFSIGFGDEAYNELGYATISAQHFGATHYTHVVTPDEAFTLLPRLVAAYDEPFANNSAIGTYFCARLAQGSGVARLLAGDGGDEIYGGNERYRTDHIFARYELVPAVLRRRLLEPMLFGLPDGGSTVLGRAQRYVRRATLPNPRRFYSYEFFFAQHEREYLAADFVDAGRKQPYAILEQHYDRTRGWSELNRLLYLDLKLTIGDNDLFKVVRTAELADVEVRFPLLDLPLVEFTTTLPASLKVRGTHKRYLFKRAFAELLPPATLAKRKHGFGVPASIWLRAHRRFRELARDVLLSSRASQRGYLQPGAVEKLFQLHAGEPSPYYGDLLWVVLMLELWHRRAEPGGLL